MPGWSSVSVPLGQNTILEIHQKYLVSVTPALGSSTSLTSGIKWCFIVSLVWTTHAPLGPNCGGMESCYRLPPVAAVASYELLCRNRTGVNKNFNVVSLVLQIMKFKERLNETKTCNVKDTRVWS